MPVDNTDDILVIIRATIETHKPSYQSAANIKYSSNYTTRNASTSAISHSTALPDYLTPSSQSHNKIESTQEVVQKIRSERAASESDVSNSVVFPAAFPLMLVPYISKEPKKLNQSRTM